MPKFVEVLLKQDTIPFRINRGFSIQQKNVNPCTYKQNVLASFWLSLHQVWWSDASNLHTDMRIQHWRIFLSGKSSYYIMSAIFGLRFPTQYGEKSKLHSRTWCKLKKLKSNYVVIRKEGRKSTIYPANIHAC